MIGQTLKELYVNFEEFWYDSSIEIDSFNVIFQIKKAVLG